MSHWDDFRLCAVETMFLFKVGKLSYEIACNQLNMFNVKDRSKQFLMDVLSEEGGDPQGYTEVFQFLNFCHSEKDFIQYINENDAY